MIAPALQHHYLQREPISDDIVHLMVLRSYLIQFNTVETPWYFDTPTPYSLKEQQFSPKGKVPPPGN